MLTWSQQLDLYEREYKKLSRAPLTLSLDQILRTVGPVDYSDEAAEACRVSARTRQWPPLSDQARMEVCLSLACAGWYCETAVLTGSPEEEEESEQEAVESLLVDYWRDEGRSQWLWRRHVLTPDEREGV